MFSFSKKCPYCKEKIRKAAVICKHCRSNIGPNGKTASHADEEGFKYIQNGFAKINSECDAIEDKIKIRTGLIFIRHLYSSEELVGAMERIESFVEKMRDDLEEWEAVNRLPDQVKTIFNKKAGEVYHRLESLHFEIEQRKPTWWEKVQNVFRRIFDALFSFFSFKLVTGRKPSKFIATAA
jgi:hypothetical protein